MAQWKRIGLYFELMRGLKFPYSIPRCANYLKFKTSKIHPISQYSPQQVSLLLINRCNLRCNYCGSANDGIFDDNEKKEITLDFVKKIFNTPLLKKTLYVNLLGGEPLLCNDIVDIVSYLHSIGCLTLITTNGLLLPKYAKDLSRAGLNKLSVSVYPKNINFLKEHLPAIAKLIKTQNSYVITRSILEKKPEEILDVIEFTKNAGSTRLRFWLFRPSGKNADLSELVTDDNLAYKEFYRQTTEKYANFIDWPTNISVSGGGGRRQKRCRQLWQIIPSIDAKGIVGTCCGPNMKLRSDVNILTNNFNEIWNHSKIVDLRSRLLDDSSGVPEECKYCNFLEEAGL
jgi:MoaA/NifB/PqqE/SkfB family radical SAM enzyme